MALGGLEPPTAGIMIPSLYQLSYRAVRFTDGRCWVRTSDFHLVEVALYQTELIALEERDCVRAQ